MMRAVVLLVGLMQPPVSGDSVWLCVRDALSGAPLVGAQLRFSNGASRTLDDACVSLRHVAAELRVARLGYHPRTVMLGTPASGAGERTITVAMTPRLLGSTRDSSDRPSEMAQLATQRVVADAPVAPRAGVAPASISARAARERGTTAMNGVLALLPYTSLRSARGETGLSLRGARREQVVITLDGLPLNDPATGLADVSDLPLAALQSITVTPGADPVNVGSGANGGVLALASAANRVLAVHTGAFGQVAAEGSYTGTRGDTRWQSALSHRRAVNDFTFVNTAGQAPARESRVNNDESRTVFTASAMNGRAHWMAMASLGDRGMVGAANVRAYDEDRARTARVFLRGQVAAGRTLLVTGLRHFDLRYRDPQRPVLNTQATASAADIEWRGSAWRGAWRLGAGTDHLTGTGAVRQRRSRGFAAWGWQREPSLAQRLAVDAGVRSDLVQGAGIQPTGAVGATWRAFGSAAGSSWSLLARGAQAVRVPTLYDLYFSSPQRLTVRALDPERVTLDASAGTKAVWQRARWRAVAEGSLVTRDTRNAIVWFPGNFGWSPANVGLERLRGTESRLDVTTPRFSVSAWHTWYRSELRSGALLIPTPYVPQHSLAANGAWRMGTHTISTNVRVQGRRPYTAGPRNSLFELPAVTIADVAWSQRLRFNRVEALWAVTLENVTDVQWQSVRGFPMPGRGWSASFTLAPRS
jgi:outer membrane cobalamin receptor